MNRTVIVMTLALLLVPGVVVGASVSSFIGIQEQEQQQGPPWTREESVAFNAAFTQQDVAKRIEGLEKFVSENPSSALVPLAKRFLVGLYASAQDLSKTFEAAEAYFSSHHEKYAEAFKLVLGDAIEKAGGKLPARPTEDFQMVFFLVDTANRAAKSGNHDFDAPAMKYTQQALAMVRSGGAPPTIPPSTWQQNESTIMATLHQTIGLIKLHRQDYNGALESMQKAGQVASNDPATFYLQGEALRSGRYADSRRDLEETRKKLDETTQQINQIKDQVDQVNKELQDLSNKPATKENETRAQELQKQGEDLAIKGKELSELAQQQSDQIDAELKRTDQVVDHMIQVYAKAVALSDGVPQLKEAARKHLEAFWIYRNQKLDGLDQMIRRMKTEMPQSMASSSAN